MQRFKRKINADFEASEAPLELNRYERSAIMEVFKTYSLQESRVNSEGKFVKKYMRQRIIWIQSPDFKRQHQHLKTYQSLFKRKIIRPHIVGFQMSLRAEYLEQIYDLADQDYYDLVEQLANLWVEGLNLE